MNDQIKILSLAVIAVCLVVQTVIEIATIGSGSSNNTPAVQAQNQPNNPQPNPQQNKPPQLQAQQANKQKQQQKSQSNLPKTTVKFEKKQHDFGTIPQNKKVRKDFKFTNTGDNPLVINNAKGSCGCTVPEYPKKPIPPGETGNITVEYSSGKRKGKQRNTVTINANTKPSPMRLQISAEVDPNKSS